MTTTISHPVRGDVAADAPRSSAPAASSTRWALAGLGAGITGVITIASSMMVDAVYSEDVQGDAEAITAKLDDQVPQMFVMHSAGVICALLMIVFAAGLFRRLRAVAPDSVAPTVAFSGLLGTAFILMLGTGLDTEFISVFAYPSDAKVVPETAVFFNNWIGTIPWIWGLMGLSGIALFSVSRAGGVAKWLGLVGLVGGGITMLFGISPLQYMAGMTGPVGLIVVSLGFVIGDKAFRGRA